MTTFQSQVEVCIGYMSNCFSLQKVEAALRPPFLCGYEIRFLYVCIVI